LIYVFYGEDDFSSSEAIKPLIEAVGPEDMRDTNVSTLLGARFSVQDFGAAAMVVPFLADRRLVIVRGLLATVEGQRGGARRGRKAKAEDEGPAAALAKLLPDLPPSTDVVFLDGKVSASNPILAAIKGLGSELVKPREFQLMRRDALGGWIQARATAKGATIEPQATAELAELVGPNLWAMDGELEKLTIYVGARPITLADVQALVTGNREASVFELVDAIMDKRPDAALEVTERLLFSGASGPYLISMIARQARMVAIAQDLGIRKIPQNEWAQRIGTSSDFVVRKTSEQARRFSPEAVRGLYRLLLDADMAMKSSDSTDELILTELLAQAGALRAAPRSAARPR
jgi:DNA polymerase III subunit delta